MNTFKPTTISTEQLCIPSVKLLGDYWSLRIIDALAQHETRFCDLQRKLDNINPVTLTGRLKKLEDAGVVARHESSETISVAYSLSPLGHEALPVIEALNHFSRQSARQS